MNEAFLHYIWQYRLFDNTELFTDDHQQVEVVRPGKHNTGAGPDFFNGLIRLNGTIWAGNIEIHIHSSDWQRHNHHHDPVYDSCVLHVVFNNDSNTLRLNGTRIPTIELKGRFPSYLWSNYLELIATQSWVACESRLGEIDTSTWKIIHRRMIIERLENKSTQILTALKNNQDDWDETFYQHLSRNFGFQLNAMPFEMLARSCPLKILRKEGNSIQNMEAILFGQAGMLGENFFEDYPRKLFEDYTHFALQYSLKPIPFSSWKFLRLRPVNFPAVRIAQLAAFLKKTNPLFRQVADARDLIEIFKLFDVKTSPYWETHYHFRKVSPPKKKTIGKQSVSNLIINTCVPFIYAWNKFNGADNAASRPLAILEELDAESNHLTGKWKERKVSCDSALVSQSLLELYHSYCAEKKCLTCNIGNRLINIHP